MPTIHTTHVVYYHKNESVISNMTMVFLKQNLDYLVFGTLGVMSFLMLWFAIEHYLYYLRIKLKNY